MPDDENENTLPTEPEEISIEVPEPESIEPIAEDEEAWQQPDPPPDLLPNPPAETLVMLQNQLTAMQAIYQELMGQVGNLQAQLNQNTSLLQSALPGLQVLATLADETTDRKTRRQINRTMKGR